MKSLTFSCLICALNLYFAQKFLRKAKFVRGCYNRKKLLQTPKAAQKLPSTNGKGLRSAPTLYSEAVKKGVFPNYRET